MVVQSVVSDNGERIKKLGEIRIEQDTNVEELQAIKMLLVKAGLILDVKERTLIILSKVRDVL